MKLFKRCCIVCGEAIRSAVSARLMQDLREPPMDAVAFNAYGNYGSRLFDSMGREKLEICVCDRCLDKHSDRVVTVTLANGQPVSARKGVHSGL